MKRKDHENIQPVKMSYFCVSGENTFSHLIQSLNFIPYSLLPLIIL